MNPAARGAALRLLRPVLLAISVFAAQPAAAQNYPDRPVRLVVPFPPGGAVDVLGRIVAERLSSLLGQAVLVDNRSGAGGAIGAEAVARSPADGYTLLLGTGTTHGSNPAVNKKLPYDAVKDFAPVVTLVYTPYVLVVHPSVPAKSAAEFIALARARPGKINFESYGNGSSNHLVMELFKAMTGVDLVHVPYKGAAPAVTALLAGEVDVGFDAIANTGAHLRSGKLRLLAVSGLARSSIVPEAPTLNESAVPGFEAGTWFAVFAPEATPAPVLGRLNRDINTLLLQPDLRERLNGMAFEVVGGSRDALGEAVRREVAKWVNLVRERNLKFD